MRFLQIRSELSCMTADYTRDQPASEWPPAGQPCKVGCDLHTIARAHNHTFFVRPIGTLCPDVAAAECVIMCTAVLRSDHAQYCVLQYCQYTIKTYAKMALFRLVLTGPSSRYSTYM